jgi:hypothetical protein
MSINSTSVPIGAAMLPWLAQAHGKLIMFQTSFDAYL